MVNYAWMKPMHITTVRSKRNSLFKVEYADYCVCTFATDNQDRNSDCSIHIERIDKNPNKCIVKPCHFFMTYILPGN